MWGKLEKRLRRLEATQSATNELLKTVLTPLNNADVRKIDQIIRDLSRRVIGDQPHASSYLNERLRTYEMAVLNIKQLGYELGRALTEVKLQRSVPSPSLVGLKSSLCKQADVESDWFVFWCQEMKSAPIYHRKIWELCYVAQAVWEAGRLVPGAHGLGFGCGNEPLPSVFAKYGAHVLATDLDPSRPEARGWQNTGQHGDSAEGFRNRGVCPDEKLLLNIGYRPVDMNDIPHEFDASFDFCWSACALEHVGSIAKGLAFIENSLRTLKPGGVAVHTTEFNLENGDTIDNWPTVLFQQRHLIEFAERLRDRGFDVAPLDFNPGNGVLDGFVDIPPWRNEAVGSLDSAAHLKLCVDGFPCTSVGLIARVPG